MRVRRSRFVRLATVVAVFWISYTGPALWGPTAAMGADRLGGATRAKSSTVAQRREALKVSGESGAVPEVAEESAIGDQDPEAWLAARRERRKREELTRGEALRLLKPLEEGGIQSIPKLVDLISRATDASNMEVLPDHCGREYVNVETEAACVIIRFGAAARPALHQVLSSRTAPVRKRAAMVILGYVGDEATARLLLDRLDPTPDGLTEGFASDALGLLGPIALGPMSEALRSDRPTVVAGVLGVLAHWRRRPELVRQVYDRAVELMAHWDDDVRVAAYGLVVGEGEERAIEPLVWALGDESHSVRYPALESLTHVAGRRFGTYGDDPKEARRWYLETWEVGASSEQGSLRPITPEASSAESNALPDLLRRASSAPAIALESALQTAAYPTAELRAAEAIRALGTDAVPYLNGVVRGDSDPSVWAAAVAILGYIGNEQSSVLLVPFLDGPPAGHTTRPEYAMRALARLETKARNEVLMVLRTGSPYQKIRALRVLRRMRLFPPPISETLTMLKDPDFRVRCCAARALGSLADPRSIPDLISALDDSSADVRWAVMSALAEFGGSSRDPAVWKRRYGAQGSKTH